MFKLEIDLGGGDIRHHYWMNKHADDFLEITRQQLSIHYGQTIASGDVTAYKIDEADQPVYEAKLAASRFNCLNCETTGVIKVCRMDGAKYLANDYVKLADFNRAKEMREAIFNGAVTPQTVTVPSTVQHDFGEGNEDAVQLLAGHELLSAHSSDELTLTGTALSPAWPYDGETFLGNN